MGQVIKHQAAYNKNYSSHRNKNTIIEGIFAYLSQPVNTGTVNKTQVAFSTLFIIFRMKKKQKDTIFPIMKMAQVSINRQNSVPAFYNRILNVQILQCNSYTSGKALRVYHLDKPQSFESLFSLYVMLSISNDWPSPINSTSKTSLISISHPIITVEHYFFSPDYQFPYWSLQFLFLTTKMYSTQSSRYIVVSTVLRESP